MKLLSLACALLAAGPSLARKPRGVKQAGPEVVVQAGRSDSDDIAFSGDGRLMVIGGDPVRLYEADSGLLVRAFAFDSQLGAKGDMALSADGAILARRDDGIEIWSTETGKLIRAYRKARAGMLAFMPDGQQLVLGTEKGLAILDLRSGNVRKLPGPEADFWLHGLVGVDAPGRFWFQHEGNLESMDPKSGKRTAAPDTPAGARNAARGFRSQKVAFNRDGKLLATSAYETDAIDLRDGTTGALLRELAIPLGRVNALGFTDDGTRLLAVVTPKVTTLDRATRTISYPDIFYYWFSAATGELLSRIAPPRTAETMRDGLAPGARVHVANGVDVMRFFDTSTGQQIRGETATMDKVGWVSFSADGRRLLITSGKFGEGRVQLWDLASGRLARTFEGMRGLFGPDGRTAVLVAKDKATLYDARTFEQLRDLPVANALSVTYAPDGRRLAIDAYPVVRIFDVDSGEPVGEPLPGKFAGFSPDGRLLARYVSAVGQATDSPVYVHDASTFKEVAACAAEADYRFETFAFGPGGRLAMSGSERVTRPGRGLVVVDTKAKGCKVLHSIKTEGEAQTLAFTADGRQLRFAYGGQGKALDLATGRVRSLPENAIELDADRMLRPGRRARPYTTLSDGSVALLDARTGRLQARLISFGEEYVIALADSRYMASRGALKHVAFRVGNRAFPFEQFDLRFNRPDAVLEKLGVASPARIAVARAAVKKRLKRAGFTEQQLSGELQLPEVFLADPPPVSTKERVVELTIRARDARTNLDRLLVTVNDVPLGSSAGISLRERKARQLEEKVPVTLSIGKNRVQVSVLNARGVESLRRTFEVLLDLPAKKPDLYLVAVGVSQYRDAQWSLRYAGKDAGDVAAFFEKKRSAFSDVKVLKLLDGDATKEKIAAARDFLKPSTVDDQAVVFFAGHGLRDKKLDYYFATADIDFADPVSRGLPYDEIDGLLDGIGARRKLLLVDTCNSGELDKDEAALVESSQTKAAEGMISSRGIKVVVKTAAPALGMEGAAELLEDLFADVRRGSGAVAIASAGGAEFALESDAWKNGVFTYSLLSTLEGGKSRVSEVREAVSAKVLELTNGKQRPTMRRENLNFDFPVY